MKVMTLTLAVFAITGLGMAADPMLGTWKMNMEKSKFSPGPGPKNVTSVYTQDGDWIVLKSDGVDGQDATFSRTNRFKTDGKEYPFDGPNGPGKIIVKRTDDYHSEAITKLDAGGTITSRTVISKDGKTRTQTVTGVNSKGEQLKHVIVFDRQ
jgi:hypothetical protein